MANLGWGAAVAFIAKLLDKIPIQGRRERMKNELETLTKEKNELMKGKCDAKKSIRVNAINQRIDVLNQWLKNTSDAN